MAEKTGGIILSRLIVFLSIVLVPIAIFIIFLVNDFSLWFYEDPILEFWIINLLCPAIFSVSWLFFLGLFATRFAETINAMDKTISIVPLRLKMFFGINALFIMFIFVFPLVTPLVSILSFMGMAWRLTTFRKDDWEQSGPGFFTKLLMGAVTIIPIFCTVVIFPDYINLSIFLFTQIWIPLLDLIFIISLCLCTALAIGSLFIMIQHSGVSEYEQLINMPASERSKLPVRLLELGLFAFFLFLALGGFELINLFYNAGFFIVLFVSIVNFVRGKLKDKTFRGHLFGYILAAVFMGSNLIFFNVEFSNIIAVWSLFISAGLFIFVFFYVFITLNESEF